MNIPQLPVNWIDEDTRIRAEWERAGCCPNCGLAVKSVEMSIADSLHRYGVALWLELDLLTKHINMCEVKV